MTDAAVNDDLVRRFIGAWERRDTDFIVHCFTDDGVYHATPPFEIAGDGRIQAWREYFDLGPVRTAYGMEDA
ncbi:MAG TPA: nuclear transport factor 2 family protein [Mycobacteriales bacterium]|nr:nuclear transport factor 2 family protein [Mycobacteriales bacterium]